MFLYKAWNFIWGLRPFSVNLGIWWRWRVNSTPWALESHWNKSRIVLKAALDILEKRKLLSSMGMGQWNLCPPNCNLVNIPNLITLVGFISGFKVLRQCLQYTTAHKHHSPTPHPLFLSIDLALSNFKAFQMKAHSEASYICGLLL